MSVYPGSLLLAMEDEQEDLWVCNACTFHNQASCQTCCMCHTSRPGFWGPFQDCCSSLSICSMLKFLGNILSCALTGAVALFGALTGAITGGLAGHAAASGLLRGVRLGAMAGAVLSVEVLEALRVYWRSERSGSNSFPSVCDFVDDLLNGRFVQDFVVPAVSSTQQWQLNFDEMGYEEFYEVLIPGEVRVKGASKGMLQSLPKHIVSQTNIRDASGYVLSCAICLQELEQGDLARSIPTCNHTFHLKCVDQWLAKHLICPICRQYIHCENSQP